MLSHGLRILAARAVPLVAMVIFSMNTCGQENVEAESEELVVIGCRDTPSGSTAVSLEVTEAWVEGAELFADLLVANHSESAVRLPRENAGFRYWEIANLQEQVLEDPNVRVWTVEGEDGPVTVLEVTAPEDEAVKERLTMGGCAGLPTTRPLREVIRMMPVPLEHVVGEKDIESIAPGQTVLLRAGSPRVVPVRASEAGRGAIRGEV